MRPQRLVGLIIILGSLLLILASRYWYSTRTFLPLERPVSIAPGHISTDEFKINLSGRYHIALAFPDHTPDTDECNVFKSLSQKWLLKRDGVVVASSVDTSYGRGSTGIVWGPYFGSFKAGTGKYKLEIEILTGAACADSKGPHLEVWTYHDSARDVVQTVFWFGICLAFIAGFVVLRSFASSDVPPDRDFSITDSPSFDRGSLSRHKNPRRIRIFAKDPSFGLMASLVMGTVLLAIWVCEVMIYSRAQSRGVWVYLLRTTPTVQLPAQDDFPILRLDQKDNDISLFVNSRAVTRAEVKEVLNSALQTRSKRFVYLAANPFLDYGQAAQGIDIIHSVKAEVILYTPKMGGPEFEPTMPQSSRPPKPVK